MDESERLVTIERLRPWVERARHYSGWQWEDDVRPRLLGAPKPWSYIGRARELIADANLVLDIGTGGGERFSEVLEGFDGNAIATEEWHVNAPVAARRLARLGVPVVRANSLQLPLGDSSFELVLNRHEELDPAEVKRALRPGGRCLTQQVNVRHWQEIFEFFPRAPGALPIFESYRTGFDSAGMEVVDAREHDALIAFPNLGAFVFMLCVAPWTIPDFDPLGSDVEALARLERARVQPEGLVLTDSSCLIEATKT